MFLRSAFNYDRDLASDESALSEFDVSQTKQAFKEECDINTIVRRFGLTGMLPEGVRMPTFSDFGSLGDFHGAMNAIARANEAFDAMPAEIRSRFANDPQAFVSFCSDAKNAAEAARLGLIDAQVWAERQKALEAAGSAPGGGSTGAA